MTNSEVANNPGKLYICSTPIGNLEDITMRVLRILKEVDIIAAEDTRHTKKLLNYYNINTPLTSCHEHNELEKGKKIIQEIKSGKNVALVSDAGTPGISDPGHKLISLAIEEGINIVPVPGASASITALVVSGLPTERFCFEGFLPREKKLRGQLLSEISNDTRTFIIYEAPHRLKKTLRDLHEKLGERKIAVIKELTKIHEKVFRGNISEIISFFENNEPRGEFAIVLEGAKNITEAPKIEGTESLYKHVKDLISEGYDKKSAIKKTSLDLGISKNEVYNAVLEAEKKK